MKSFMVTIQGQKALPDIEAIRKLLVDNPSWHRTQLSQELCQRWNWRNDAGQLKDMACRSLLLKLERAGEIYLPAPRRKSNNTSRNRLFPSVPYPTEEVTCDLKVLIPLQITLVAPRSVNEALFNCLIARYHYLGHRNTVGENLKYLVHDRQGRPLACLLFGSAAWKVAARDSFIGWSPQVCQQNLGYLTNNTRFMILPWIKVPHLASHILSRISRRLCPDWQSKYGHPIHLLETFVDRSRFRGTCYRAANWILTGQTTGRTRNDRYNDITVPIKDVYVYPLSRNFRRELCHDP